MQRSTVLHRALHGAVGTVFSLLPALVAVPFVLVGTGCAGSLEATVHDARSAHRYPTGLTVVYDDRTPLLGGDRIEVGADGQVRWWQEPPVAITAAGAPEDTFDDAVHMPPSPSRAPEITGTASPEALQRLLSLLESIAPWSRRPADDDDDGRLERRRALLEVRNGSDVESSWQWADPTESGDARITAVRRWAEREIERPARPVLTNVPDEETPEETGPNPMLRNP